VRCPAGATLDFCPPGGVSAAVWHVIRSGQAQNPVWFRSNAPRPFRLLAGEMHKSKNPNPYPAGAI